MHYPIENATHPIWRVLASSGGISSWTPLKPQQSIPGWLSVQWEPSACRACQCCQRKGSSIVCGWFCSIWPSWVWGASMLPLRTLSLGLWVIAVDPDFIAWHFFQVKNFIAYRSSKVQNIFLKFTSSDDRALVGCIPIPAVGVPLNLKS